MAGQTMAAAITGSARSAYADRAERTMRHRVARVLLVFQREAVDVGSKHVQLVLTQVSL
ncbi:hypothetical protein GCM10009083_12940 [Halopseudomonas pertucinogena]|uniref:Uncharacterized protein n=1 Tax=Halopseudomonas pertucinogena TaxID=86175 RepID=A0ABQ2CPM3_9GAMM|nr:hypothetical protein GCM10009083_12940 [Halopseudomonas pertucinogena]